MQSVRCFHSRVVPSLVFCFTRPDGYSLVKGGILPITERRGETGRPRAARHREDFCAQRYHRAIAHFEALSRRHERSFLSSFSCRQDSKNPFANLAGPSRQNIWWSLRLMGSMLVPPRKKSLAVDYPKLLARFLTSTYSPQEATDNRDGIKALAEMRAQCLSAAEVKTEREKQEKLEDIRKSSREKIPAAAVASNQPHNHDVLCVHRVMRELSKN